MSPRPVLALFLILTCAAQAEDLPHPQTIALDGTPLFSAPTSEDALRKLALAQADYDQDPSDINAIIWFGRRTAYTGEYQGAIEIYTAGMEHHPNDPRLYRHRGHRFISTRQFDRAIADLEHAVTLIEGQPNEIEPDGLPNARNIPVSTLHGNIWYHLGLAYYLKHDWENALRAYLHARASSENDDNVVSTTHWIYMILRRMGRPEAAAEALKSINNEMNVIENFAYQELCLFYQGQLTLAEIDGTTDDPAGAAVAYGLANWFEYNGDEAEADRRRKALLNTDGWAAFGFIAAESDEYRSQ